MIKECNFKYETIPIKTNPQCSLGNITCCGEDKCIFYQIYKKQIPKCGICGEPYEEDFDWDNYMGEINFAFANIKPPLHAKCYEKYCKDRGYDG